MRYAKSALMLVVAIALLVFPAVEAAQSKITIAAFHPWTITPAWNKVVAEFNKEHPDIVVELTQVPEKEHAAKVKTLLASGMPPDLAWSGSVDADQLAMSGVLEDFAPYLKRSGIKWPRPQYIAGATSGPRLGDGKIWTIGIEAFAYGIFYNKGYFAQAGLVYPERGWTWDEFLQSAKRLTIPNTRWGFEFVNSSSRYDPFIWGSGGRYWDRTGTNLAFRTAEWARGLQFYIDLRNVHQVVGGTFDNRTAAMSGKGAWSIPPPGSVAWRGMDWGFVTVPKGPVQEAARIFNQGYIMFGDSKNKDAAWKFVEWAMSPAGQKAWMVHGGRLPLHLPTVQEYAYLHLDAETRKNVIQTISVMAEIAVEDEPVISGLGSATEPLGTALQRAWNGEISVQQAVEESWDACVARLAELKASLGIK